MKTFQRLMLFAALTLLLFSVATAIAAANTIPATSLDYNVLPLGLNDLKPSACAGIYVTNLITGSGTILGTAANDLILAGPAVDSVDGSDGNDCIVGGGASDICLGGPGSDIFVACESETQ